MSQIQSQLNLSSTTNNRTSSITNRLVKFTCYYDSANFLGASFCMLWENNPYGLQWRDPDLSNGTDGNGANWSNRISSYKAV